MPRVLVRNDKKNSPWFTGYEAYSDWDLIFKVALQIYLSFSHCQFLHFNRNAYSGIYTFKNTILKYYLVLKELLHNTVLSFIFMLILIIYLYVFVRTVFPLNSCLNQFLSFLRSCIYAIQYQSINFLQILEIVSQLTKIGPDRLLKSLLIYIKVFRSPVSNPLSK